ncbi:MAG TPA: pantoate--beta-alanine ligase [Oligoflexia bacterium]|nr:pantoate--beta-alanine ligase [Oligoflexia bacterium]HMR25159.1 pantoate--beta-alanine ligase [Oligoflexia bacterium]
MRVVKNFLELKQVIENIKQDKKTLGFVPTMGALHAGHLSLVDASKKKCQQTAVSIFVNPMQFGPNEDLNKYPRPLEKDLAMCEQAGVDFVFVPSVEMIYPKGFSFKIVESFFSSHLCGAYRKGYFDGICTVVMKLLHLVPCDQLFMGLKDVEQVKVIDEMIKAFHLSVEMVACPTVREDNGLAMSSRNQYLSEEEKDVAKHLYQALCLIKEKSQLGEYDTQTLIDAAKDYLKQYSKIEVQYLKILHWEDFLPTKKIQRKYVVALAAFVGTTRLIDNLIVDL